MFKLIFVILFALIVISAGLEQEQVSESTSNIKDKSETDEDKYEAESRTDFDKSSEKEKELKILRKAKRLKESNYRRALESILPAKNSEGYRRFFEDLINNSDEKSRSGAPPKEVEEVVVSDTFVDGEPIDGSGDFEPQVDGIEVVIEHITDDPANYTDIMRTAVQTSSESQDTSDQKELLNEAREHPNQDKNKNNNTVENIVLNTKGRTGLDNSRSGEMDPLHFGRVEDRRLLEPYPLSHISEVMIPHYRTALTRSGVVVSPAVYSVQTSAPIIDQVKSRNWMPARGIGPDIFGRSGSHKIGRSDSETRLIDDYNDYGSNAYSYSPSKLHLTSRQGESQIDILSKLSEASLQPSLGNRKSYRENLERSLYHGSYYPQQQQRYFSDNYRSLFRIRR